jgi:hypothetical protein|tara:strand:+ start:897 stop:2009 length:1113 start_codon:yes stop_codon:yes gene_type:complete
MSTNDINDSELIAVKEGLAKLGESIEIIAKRELPKPEFLNNEISGDKIHGGTITQFSTMGIKDNATSLQLVVQNGLVTVDNLKVTLLKENVKVEENLEVVGTIKASRLEVDELKADVRNERTSSLVFDCETESPYGKGLFWTGAGHTKQFAMQGNPDRVWSSEPIDTHGYYAIKNVPVITEDSLGANIQKSSLTELGTIKNLRTEGNFVLDQFIFYDGDHMRLGIGADAGNGQLTVSGNEVEFIVDPGYDTVKVGAFTTSDMELITDDQTRIKIKSNNRIEVGTDSESITTVKGKLGIGVNNPDVCFSTYGPIKFENKKMQVGSDLPTQGVYKKGDIVWNDEPTPTGYVGWVCIKDGTPGEWKPFGTIGA